MRKNLDFFPYSETKVGKTTPISKLKPSWKNKSYWLIFWDYILGLYIKQYSKYERYCKYWLICAQNAWPFFQGTITTDPNKDTLGEDIGILRILIVAPVGNNKTSRKVKREGEEHHSNRF